MHGLGEEKRPSGQANLGCYVHIRCNKPPKEEHDLYQTAQRLGEVGFARALGFLVNKRDTLEKARVYVAKESITLQEKEGVTIPPAVPRGLQAGPGPLEFKMQSNLGHECELT